MNIICVGAAPQHSAARAAEAAELRRGVWGEVTMCKAVTPADRRASKKYSVISITSFTVTSDTDPAPAPARTPAPPPAPSEPAWSWAVLAASFLCLCVLDGIR